MISASLPVGACRTAVEHISALEAAETDYDVFRWLRNVAYDFELEFFIVCATPGTGGDCFGNRYLISNWDRELLAQSQSEGLFDTEPYVSMRHLAAPVAGVYADVAASTGPDRSTRTAEVLKEFGHESFAILPVWTPKGVSGTVNLTGRRKPLPLDALISLQYLASMAFAKLHDARETHAVTNELTERQTAVLRLTAGGFSTEEVARELGISAHTVNFHLNTLKQMAGATNKTHLVALALEKGWIPFPSSPAA